MLCIGFYLENLKEMLGKKMEQRRRELGYSTQESLALAVAKACRHELPIDRTRISRWESGESGVSRKYRPFLAQVLKVDVSFFDPISLIRDDTAEEDAPSREELIANIVTGLATLDYDELETISSAVDEFASSPAAHSKTSTTS